MNEFKESGDSFSKARRLLMLPRHGKEAYCIVEALGHCFTGLEKIDPSLSDVDILERVKRIKQLISFVGVPDPKNIKLLEKRAGQLTEQIVSEFCCDLDALATIASNYSAEA